MLDQDVSSQLLFQGYACMTAAMLPALIIMDSDHETVNPDILLL